MKAPVIIYIEWCDALSYEGGWHDEDDVFEWAENANWIVKEVGFLLKETKKYILLASKYNKYDDEETQYGHIMKIPKTWILKRTILNNRCEEKKD